MSHEIFTTKCSPKVHLADCPATEVLLNLALRRRISDAAYRYLGWWRRWDRNRLLDRVLLFSDRDGDPLKNTDHHVAARNARARQDRRSIRGALERLSAAVGANWKPLLGIISQVPGFAEFWSNILAYDMRRHTPGQTWILDLGSGPFKNFNRFNRIQSVLFGTLITLAQSVLQFAFCAE